MKKQGGSWNGLLKTDLESDTDRDKASRRFRKRKSLIRHPKMKAMKIRQKRESLNLPHKKIILQVVLLCQHSISRLCLEKQVNNFTFIYNLRFLS